MAENNFTFEELSDKIMAGMHKAYRKLVEESAALGRSLVVEIDGEVREVPAKELLKQFE